MRSMLGFEFLRHDLAAVFLHGAQRGELTTANDQVFDGLSICVGGGTGEGFHCSGELSDEPGIDLVGLGELAYDVGEAADLQWLDDDDGEACGERGTNEGLLEAAGGFDDDALDAVAA